MHVKVGKDCPAFPPTANDIIIVQQYRKRPFRCISKHDVVAYTRPGDEGDESRMKCRRGHTTYLVYLWGFDDVLAKGECNELRVLDAKSPDRQKARRLDRPMEIK